MEIVEPVLSKTDRQFRLWRPNAFLMNVLPRIGRGRALDLGCGCGREALAIAAAGFEVLACDRLEDALEKGRDMARRYLQGEGIDRSGITWQCVDLEEEGPPEGRFDLITSFRYLHRPLMESIVDRLRPGGSLVLETFTATHRERYGKPSSDRHVLQLG